MRVRGAGYRGGVYSRADTPSSPDGGLDRFSTPGVHMSSTPVLPAPDAPPLAQGPSRRTVVGAGLWSAPVLAMASSAPAFAAASGQQALTLSVPTSGIPLVGSGSADTVVRDAQGAPVAGAPVSLSGPLGSTFGARTASPTVPGVYDVIRPRQALGHRDPPFPSPRCPAVSRPASLSRCWGPIVLAFGRNVWAEWVLAPPRLLHADVPCVSVARGADRLGRGD